MVLITVTMTMRVLYSKVAPKGRDKLEDLLLVVACHLHMHKGMDTFHS